MKKLILFLFIAFALLRCTSQDEREVVLFNDITFQLHEGEEIIIIDSETKDDFHSYFNSSAVQIPLFRCIKADNYLIYLGIPIHASINKLAEAEMESIGAYQSVESDDSSYFFIDYQRNVDHITAFSKVFDDNFVYVLTVSESKELSDSLFKKEALSKRLNH